MHLSSAHNSVNLGVRILIVSNISVVDMRKEKKKMEIVKKFTYFLQMGHSYEHASFIIKHT